MNGNGLGVGWAGEPGQDSTQILGDREVHFAYGLRRATAHELDTFHKFLKQLHALFALVARHIVGNAGDDGKLIVRILRAVEDYTMRINQLDLVAITREGDRRALREFDAKTIRKNPVYGGGLDPGNLLELGASLVERNLQDAAIAVLRERSQHGFVSDHVIPGYFNLLGLEQQHGRRIQKKLRTVIRPGDDRTARYRENQDAAIERPAATAEFLAANLDGLLATEVARLFVGNQLRPVTVARFRSRSGVPLHGLQAFQTTTSFSKATP